MIAIATFVLALVASCRATGEKLSMTIHQSGFHRYVHPVHISSFVFVGYQRQSCRTLRYDTYFLQPWRPEPCDFCLEQTIPAGAYVDTDQLDDLVRQGQLVYYTSARPNVEAIANKSAPFQLYVYGNTDSTNTINLPVHFRYHLAGDQRYTRLI